MRIKFLSFIFLLEIFTLSDTAALNQPVVKGTEIYAPMSDSTHARRSEGCFLKLSDDSILHMYVRFKASYLDHSAADLVKIVISPDGKKVISNETVVIPKEASANVMVPSLLRLKDGRILMIYLEKSWISDTVICRVAMRFSPDEGKTWTPKRYITQSPVYCVILNAAAIQLESGRICIPVSQCRYKNNRDLDTCGVVYCLYSDDYGKTWKESQSVLFPPDRTESNAGYQEPSAVEISANHLLMYMRSDLGYLWKTVSKDGGITWSKPELDKNFPVVIAPPKIARLKDNRLILFFNQNPNVVTPLKNNRNRSALVIKTSSDNGRSWKNAKLIEPVTGRHYSYPALIATSDGAFLVSYYMYDKNIGNYWHLKVKKIFID